ncbi:hypothetical protein Q3G72_002722 [Acer saccharum]|nr:hypothetical protein Q3G72_002722 [Acer saccharum]
MSSVRETTHDPSKSWRFLGFPTIKSCDIFNVVVKTTLVVFTVLYVSVFFYYSFSNQVQLPSCPHCDRLFSHRKFSDIHNNISADSHEKTNISHIMFGIAGSAKTWYGRRSYIELWWKPNVTRGFVWLDEKPPANYTWPETSPAYKISADTSRFNYTCWYGSRSALRLTRIVKESLEVGLDNVRWFVMGDDDTVFFVENLVTVLAKYDHNQMYYIGDDSESVEQDMIHSYNTAYGGGGYAISYPLAAELVRILDGCLDRYASLYGADQKIQACIAEIGVPITKEPGFHQVDVKGNPYGLLAAHPLAPLVSLHHVNSVESLFPSLTRIEALKRLVSAYKMDPDRTLQHSFCYDLNRNWSVSVSWGYTLHLYPSLVTAKRMETAYLTFRTWKTYKDEPFTFNTQPLSQDQCERPIVYLLDRVEWVGKDKTLTTYKRQWNVLEKTCETDDYSAALDVQQFNVSSTTLKSDIWKMAPRRQCCDIFNGTDQGMLQVKIRGCNKFESVTPP